MGYFNHTLMLYRYFYLSQQMELFGVTATSHILPDTDSQLIAH